MLSAFPCVRCCSEADRDELFVDNRLLLLRRLRRTFVVCQSAVSVRRRLLPEPAQNRLRTA